MNGAFYIGAVGLSAEQRALDVAANNIANINTPAFKRSSARFSELVMPLRDGSGMPIPARADGSGFAGVAVDAASRVWSQGDMRQTGQAMDIAIDGPGFIELMGSAGRTLLWRGGTMKINGDGYLAAADGTPLRAMISVPQEATELAIDRDGKVSALLSAEEGRREIGRIDVVVAKDPDSLAAVGSGYFETSDESAVQSVDAGEEGGGVFAQGMLEQANVQLSDEMVTLLLLQRAYAADAQLVQAGDQLMAIANGLRR